MVLHNNVIIGHRTTTIWLNWRNFISHNIFTFLSFIPGIFVSYFQTLPPLKFTVIQLYFIINVFIEKYYSRVE